MCKHGDLTLMKELGPHGRYIDSCMVPLIRQLRTKGLETRACCCGHGVYLPTIVIKHPDYRISWEHNSDTPLTTKRGMLVKRNFYRKDKNGLYFIPKVVKKIGKYQSHK